MSDRIDGVLRAALGTPTPGNFSTWRASHADAIGYLNPVVTKLARRRRALISRLAQFGAAAAAMVCAASWLLAPPAMSFAQTATAIDEAQTIQWTETIFAIASDKDGSAKWLVRTPAKITYRHPGMYRRTALDQNGKPSTVTIFDSASGKHLTLDMKNRKTVPGPSPFQALFHPKGPFGETADILREKQIEIVGSREFDGKRATVVRYRREPFSDRSRNSVDIFIDSQSKELLGINDPGIDVFDPATMPERDNAPGEPFTMNMLGTVTSDIVLNPELDPNDFSLTPPADFQSAEQPDKPVVTEQQLIEWWRAIANVNDGFFIDDLRGTLQSERIAHAFRSVEASILSERGVDPKVALGNEPFATPTDAEKQLVELFKKHTDAAGGRIVIPDREFVRSQISPRSFRYVGKGVRLGESDKLVCWYKLKTSGQLRGIFGDLTVRDVKPDELPLPIDD